MGMEFRPFYMAREWEKMGHKVRIIGAGYSHLRTQQPAVQKNYCIEYIDGIEYQLIKAGEYTGNGVKRAVSIFKFVGSLWLHAGQIAKDFRPDAVITSSTYPLDAYAGYKIARKSGGRYFHEAHDVWPLTLIELGSMSKNHPFVSLLNKAEQYAYRKAEKVISVLPNSRIHMLEQGMQSEDKFAYIPNGIVKEDWQKPDLLQPEHKALFDKLHDEGKHVVVYLGGHALSNALDQLLDAAKMVSEVAFVLIGKGAEKPRLQKRVETEKITNVFFLPPIPKLQVPNALKEADALYLGAEHCSLYRFGVSMNKLYDYMMAGKPILYGVIASNNEVNEARCGISFDSSKPEEIAAAVKQIQAMPPEERVEMGRRGNVWVRENCDYAKLAGRFLDLIAK